MTEHDGAASGLPAQREGRGPRHASPRIPARSRLRGKALAIAAVPTALLMGAVYSPTFAVADPSVGKPCASAPDTPLQETPVPKSELTPLPGPSIPPSALATAPAEEPAAGSTAAATTAPATPAATATPAGPAQQPAQVPTQAPTVKAAAPGTATGGQVVSAVYQGAAPATVQSGIIGDVLGGIGNLILPGAKATPSASASTAPAADPRVAASPTASPSGAAATTAPSTAATPAPPAAGQPATEQAGSAPAVPTAPAPSAPKPSASAKATPKPAGSTKATPKESAAPSTTAAPSASPSAGADANCAVDARGLTAQKEGKDVVPEQNWTLRTSRLGLHHAVFNGVYDVDMVNGTKRVLKFTVGSVDIENLDMSTLEGNGKTFHVKGAPGTTSTMRNGPITMYVELLSGHLSKILGLPIPIDLGQLTLTPDTLPRWLYDLIGAIPIPLDLELTGVKAVQAGQFGGTLSIKGMKLYNDDEPYEG
ncbi:hypothetical protein [Kitasatospora sp. NPDC050543]|uniref:hypothetical protein n=1 Tax=Kitasatospora sp. NPDC050543 TaxID=3364054 RepID=UPI00379D7C94